jgi:thiamine-phosphate pyrophosphorylase
MTLPDRSVCLVTDRRRTSPGARTTAAEIAGLEVLLDEAIEAGVDLIHVRERDLDAGRLRDLVVRLMARASGRTRIVVGDRVDVAVAARADGVHVRGDGPDVRRVRGLLEDGALVGRSVHLGDPPGAGEGADYVIFGPVYQTASKPEGWHPAGVEGLRQAVAAGGRVVAIGGITPDRVAACLAAGARGVAGIGIFLPPDRWPGGLGPAAAARALKAECHART